MPLYHKHIIRNLNLEVEFQDNADAFELRNALTHVCKTELLPALENLFDEKSKRGKIIRTEKIIIDLGIIDKEGWHQSLVERVVAQLTAHFGQAPLLSKTNAPRKGDDKTPVVKENSSAHMTEISEEENIVESILYFLKTGLLPWYTVIKSREAFVLHLIRLTHHHDKSFYQRILAEVQNDEHALVRLVDQTSDNIVESILILSGAATAHIKALLNCWTEIFKQGGISHVTPKHTVYQAAVLIVAERSSERPFTELVGERIIQRLEVVYQQKLLRMFERADRSFDRTFTVGDEESKIVRFIEQRVKEVQRGVTGNKAGSKKSTEELNENAAKTLYDFNSGINPVSDDSQQSNDSSLVNRYVKNLPARKNTIKNIAESTAEGFYITNAGLVILNPFLVQLFENVGYLEEKKWISKDHRQRAMFLTHYLVTGKQVYPEFDMLLNKILMGYPLEDSLPADVVLSDFEMNEGYDVLHAVIRHWNVLKNTSIAGLQATFLQREGKLLYNDDRWLLQVEQQTADILLNRLPWGISIIKLPWMENRLHVEWT